MRWGVALVLALSAACRPEGQSDGRTSLGERVADVNFEQWHQEPTLRSPSGLGDCGYLADLLVYSPKTPASYALVCPANSWACLHWQPIPGARVRRQPAAVMSPALPASLWASQAVHEHLHAFMQCAYGYNDKDHLDPRVWESGGPESVEAKSFEALYLKPRFLRCGAGLRIRHLPEDDEE